jgi:predicted transposase YbfD/YdcC
LKSLVEVRSERMTNHKIEHGLLYYGSSRTGTPEQFANWIRGHWDIENGLHDVADVVFSEDASVVDTCHAAENMALFRRLAMNIIKTVDPKRGITDSRRNATFEPITYEDYCPDYLQENVKTFLSEDPGNFPEIFCDF